MVLELARRPLAEPADKLAAVLQEWSQSKGEPEPLAERCLAVAASDPEGPTGLAALCWAACRSTGQAGREAFSRLEGRVPTAGLEDLFGALDDLGGVQAKERNDNLGRLVLERVKRDLDHPRAPRLLCWVCVLARWAEYDEAPDYFAKAADLLVSRFADRADVNHFCESLGTIGGGAPPWAAPYERHLRAVLKESKHRHMRAFATFALAQVVQLGGEARQAEAAALYEQYLKEFDGSDPVWGSERSMRVRAGHELEVIRTLGLGMPAPEIDGVDLDGQPMRLKDHRGQVVLLSFWGTWCPACIEFVPYEKEIVERLSGKPFALVGVNGDPLDTDLRPAVKKHRITWRSFKNEQPGKPRIDREYKVRAWPTLVLIDHEGVMRARWSGTPGRKALNHEIDRLVRAAEAAR